MEIIWPPPKFAHTVISKLLLLRMGGGSYQSLQATHALSALLSEHSGPQNLPSPTSIVSGHTYCSLGLCPLCFSSLNLSQSLPMLILHALLPMSSSVAYGF